MRKIDEHLDEALGKAPEYELPYGFADKVMRRIEINKLALDRRIQVVTLMASLGFVLVAAICMVAFLDGDTLSQLANSAGWILLSGVMIVLIQYLDQKLVKGKTLRL